MKTILNVFCGVVIGMLTINSAFAQDEQLQIGLHYGVKAPYLISKASSGITVSDPSLAGDLSGWGGINADYKITKPLYIHAELNYYHNSFFYNYSETFVEPGSSYTSSRYGGMIQTMNYLEFSPMAKAAFGNKAKFYVSVGPGISYLLNAKQAPENDYFTVTKDSSVYVPSNTRQENAPASKNNTSDYHRMNLSIDGIMGFSIGRFFFDVKYSQGIVNISKEDIVKVTTRNYTARVGIILFRK